MTIASLITSASDALKTGISTVWTLMTANPLISLFVGASVISLGFAFFRKAKRTAKGVGRKLPTPRRPIWRFV